MAATHYQSSKGPRLIAEMPFTYLKNAIAVIEGQIACGVEKAGGGDRADELEAMKARLADLDALHREAEAAQVGVGARAASPRTSPSACPPWPLWPLPPRTP